MTDQGKPGPVGIAITEPAIPFGPTPDHEEIYASPAGHVGTWRSYRLSCAVTFDGGMTEADATTLAHRHNNWQAVHSELSRLTLVNAVLTEQGEQSRQWAAECAATNNALRSDLERERAESIELIDSCFHERALATQYRCERDVAEELCMALSGWVVQCGHNIPDDWRGPLMDIRSRIQARRDSGVRT